MLFTLLAAWGGAATRLLPLVIDLFKLWLENRHEFRLQEQSLEADRICLDLARVQSDALVERAAGPAELQALTEAVKVQGAATGIRWIDGLNSLIRPLITTV